MSDGHHGVESFASARTKAIESLLVEKGLIASDAIDAIVETYEQDIGPMNGARGGRPCVDRPGIPEEVAGRGYGSDRRNGLHWQPRWSDHCVGEHR